MHEAVVNDLVQARRHEQAAERYKRRAAYNARESRHYDLVAAEVKDSEADCDRLAALEGLFTSAEREKELAAV